MTSNSFLCEAKYKKVKEAMKYLGEEKGETAKIHKKKNMNRAQKFSTSKRLCQLLFIDAKYSNQNGYYLHQVL